MNGPSGSPPRTPRALLVSLRDPHDPMAEHERRCFADRASLPHDALHLWPAVEQRATKADLARYDVVFFGGSGAYSVLDDEPWLKGAFATLLDTVEARIP